MSSQSFVVSGEDHKTSAVRLQSIDALRGFDIFWIAAR